MIEQKIFGRKRFRADSLKEYGFEDKGMYRMLKKELMDGDMTAEIMVHQSGAVRGRVIDNMTGDEYVQLRNPNYTGAYVGSVREAYEDLLADIANKCCSDVAFASDQSNRIAALIWDKYSVEPDFPWEEGRHDTSGVFRHGNNKKWFALIMNIDRRFLKSAETEVFAADRKRSQAEERLAADRKRSQAEERLAADRKEEGGSDRGEVLSEMHGTQGASADGISRIVDVMNLKADEAKVTALHRIRGIYPAYHMNHSKWISVVLDDTLCDGDVMDLVDESYRLTQSGGGVLSEKLIHEVLGIADSIPAGSVISYGQIAEMIGRPKNARLVGKIMSMADRYGEHPCHRVVNHAGRTVPGWQEQRSLLEAEGVTFLANGCVDMKKHRIRNIHNAKDE